MHWFPRLFPRVVLALLCWRTAVVAPAQNRFVRVENGRFMVNGQPYFFIGTNYWYGSLLADTRKSRRRLRKELKFLKKQGVDNLRVLVGAEGVSDYPFRVSPALQPQPGQYDEKRLRGLDYLLDQMARRRMYAVLYLTNNWEWSGGLAQYRAWEEGSDIPFPRLPGHSWGDFMQYVSIFHSCTPCKEAVVRHIRFILNRTNSVNGRPYTQDPTIMAWQVANEPRPMRADNAAPFAEWLRETTALIKSIDPNHLVTLGNEGTAGCEGSMDLYEQIHTDPNVDYMTIHIWAKNWGWFPDTAIAQNLPGIIEKCAAYVDQHDSVARRLAKPLVLEEFGLPRDGHSFSPTATVLERDAYYSSIFKKIEQNRNGGGMLAGCNFWAFGGHPKYLAKGLFWKPGDAPSGDPPQEEQGLNSVFQTDKSTWTQVKTFSLLLQNPTAASFTLKR